MQNTKLRVAIIAIEGFDFQNSDAQEIINKLATYGMDFSSVDVLTEKRGHLSIEGLPLKSTSIADRHLQIANRYPKDDFVLVLEEDAQPRSDVNWKRVTDRIQARLRKSDAFDILYLGGTPLDIGRATTSGFYEGLVWATHAVIYSNRFLKVLNQLSVEDICLQAKGLFVSRFLDVESRNAHDTAFVHMAVRKIIATECMKMLPITQSSLRSKLPGIMDIVEHPGFFELVRASPHGILGLVGSFVTVILCIVFIYARRRAVISAKR